MSGQLDGEPCPARLLQRGCQLWRRHRWHEHRWPLYVDGVIVGVARLEWGGEDVEPREPDRGL